MTIYLAEFGGWIEVLNQIYSNFKRTTSVNYRGQRYDLYEDIISKKYIAIPIH